MPEIKINIVDNTSAVLGSTDVYTVFIPGNSKYIADTIKNDKLVKGNEDYFGKYNLFTSLTDFNKVIKEPENYTSSDYPYTVDDELKYADPGYRLAKLALENNLPVLYYIPDYVAEVPGYTTYSAADPQPTSETFDEGTYYTRSGEGTEQSPYVYTLAETFESETDYYVATEVPAVPAHEQDYEDVKTFVNADASTSTLFSDLEDKSLFDIRFVTNGGYGWCSIVDKSVVKPNSITNAINVAKNRGDCIALIDFAKDIKAKDLLVDGIDLSAIRTKTTPANYAAFIPWVTYDGVCLPASAGYLEAFGKQTKNNPNWFATAGFIRGIISGTPNEVIGELLANKLIKDDNVSINPITRVSTSSTNFYNMIWGNRTTYYNAKGLKASNFLNIIQLCCDLSKRLYRASKENMYEQNTDRLWFNFKAPVEELLNNMLQNEGILGYKIIRQNATERAQVRALVKIVPIEAVEKFDITIELADNLEVSVTIAE